MLTQAQLLLAWLATVPAAEAAATTLTPETFELGFVVGLLLETPVGLAIDADPGLRAAQPELRHGPTLQRGELHG